MVSSSRSSSWRSLLECQLVVTIELQAACIRQTVGATVHDDTSARVPTIRPATAAIRTRMSTMLPTVTPAIEFLKDFNSMVIGWCYKDASQPDD